MYSAFDLYANHFKYMTGYRDRNVQPDPLDKIDLVDEYKLIMKKESKLSANNRARVIAIYKNKFIDQI